jgi:beta-1,4-mannosyl-glycoprotein beta-1,4-N-acetylglucosaminyltransferase
MIIDAFVFNNELNMLELRLGQLDKVVDYFVFIEVGRTYRGSPKPLYYQENKHLFERWNHKIITASPVLRNAGAWEFEILQRNVIIDLINELYPEPTTTLSFSDCDEIPNPEVLKNYTPDMGLRNLKQHTFYYNYSNCFDYGNRSWSRARLGRVQDMRDLTAYEFRQGKRDLDPSHPSIENAGWHGSYFTDDISVIRGKVNSISHDDMAPFVNARTDKQIAEDIFYGRDLYHRQGVGDAQKWATDDPRLPSYFLENKERFKMFTHEHFAEKYKTLLQQ